MSVPAPDQRLSTDPRAHLRARNWAVAGSAPLKLLNKAPKPLRRATNALLWALAEMGIVVGAVAGSVVDKLEGRRPLLPQRFDGDGFDSSPSRRPLP